MSTELVTMFDGAGLPAHLADLNEQGNIVGRDTIPMVSFRGKVWRIAKDGSEDILMNKDGDPVQSINVVVLDYNKARSRAYFEGAYVEGQSARPTCWSNDGVKPEADSTNLQAQTCATCPQAVKGARQTPDGKDIAACSQFKRVALVPAADTTFAPLLLKLPQTSIWDKDAEEMAAKGFYAFDQYMDLLRKKGVNHTATVITKIKFDPRVAYPKLLFGPVNWLPNELHGNVADQLAKKDELNIILNVNPSAVPNEPEAEPVATVAAAATTVQAPTTPVPATPPPKPVAAKPPTKPAAAKPTPAPAVAAADPDDAVVLGKPTAAAVAAAKTTAVDVPAVATAAGAGAGLSTLLTAWDDA